MNANECLQILRDIKSVAFATVDSEGNPSVRIIDVMLVEDDRLYFCTARGKSFYKQLIETNKVAVTGLNEKYQTVRIFGEVKKEETQELYIDRIFENNPSLNTIYPNESRYILEPFFIDKADIEFFDLSSDPINREYFSINKPTKEQNGFFITDECVKCGVCKRNCPQKCIEGVEHLVINQKNCLHCGLCFEKCPHKKIIKIGE